jgi:hypothetical protein
VPVAAAPRGQVGDIRAVFPAWSAAPGCGRADISRRSRMWVADALSAASPVDSSGAVVTPEAQSPPGHKQRGQGGRGLGKPRRERRASSGIVEAVGLPGGTGAVGVGWASRVQTGACVRAPSSGVSEQRAAQLRAVASP